MRFLKGALTDSTKPCPALCDAHAHLYDLSPEQCLDTVTRALDAGVTVIANTAVSLASSQVVLAQKKLSPHLRAIAGISPFDVQALSSDWQKELSMLLASKAFCAVGEIGLDASNPRYPEISEQRDVFEKQLALAVSHNLPAIIHSRGAEAEVLAALKAIGVQKAVFHCFTGTKEILHDICNAGYAISISGIVTFDKIGHVVYAAQSVPDDLLLIETDCPYLAPVPLRGKPNEPSFLEYTARAIANLRQTPFEDLAALTFRNASAIFGNP
jgi:TatD DNase family protein